MQLKLFRGNCLFNHHHRHPRPRYHHRRRSRRYHRHYYYYYYYKPQSHQSAVQITKKNEQNLLRDTYGWPGKV